MKKFIAIALAAVMLCAAGIACAETFRVGVKQDVYGFGYLDETTGEYSGMEIELGAMIADALGYDDVEYTTVTAATRGQMLDNDELDCVIATFTIKPERKESWDFSTPYYTDAVTVLVEKASGIVDLSGLAGKTVGVSTGSTSAKALATAMADAGVKYGLPRATAYRLASQTLAGTGRMQIATGQHPGVIKDGVCSPAGSTIRGVEALERAGLRAAMLDAIQATMER